METKLEKKVEYFKEHLNSGKSADALEQEFETWYEDVYKKVKYDEYLKKTKEDIQNESEIKLELIPSGESNYVDTGKCHISRTCTLEVFTNIIALRRAKENKVGETRIYFKTYDSSCRWVINNIGEIVDESQSCRIDRDTLIATKGKYTIYPHGIDCCEVHAYNYVEITKD